MSPRPVPSPTRVLLLDAGRYWRGAQRQLLLLASGMRSHGLEPLVVAPPRSALLDACKRAGIASAAREMRGTLDMLAVRGLRRLLGTWHPTVVHAHDPRSHALAMAALVGRQRPIPLVVTRRIATPPRGRIRHGARVATFIAITSAVHDALRRGGIPEERIALVHPGVMPPAVTAARNWRRECDWPAERVVAGVIGPMSELRHHAELERLVASIDAGARARLALVVLGGPSSGRAEIAGVPSYRAGFVHDVPAALAGLDLLLHPGGAEGLGTALVEGMALKVPAIAFATGGVGDIILPGKTGILVPPGDVHAFATAVGSLARDAEARQALGEAGPARALEFSAERMLAGTLAVYRAIGQGQGGPLRG